MITLGLGGLALLTLGLGNAIRRIGIQYIEPTIVKTVEFVDRSPVITFINKEAKE